MKVKTVLLYKFRCPECGTEVLVANCKDEASVICERYVMELMFMLAIRHFQRRSLNEDEGLYHSVFSAYG